MSISQVRTFIKKQIALVDPNLKEHLDLSDENIPQTILDEHYHIEYGSSSDSQDDNELQTSQSVTVKLFKRGFNKPITAMDTIIDKAHEIRRCIISTTATLGDDMLKVESISLTPEPIDETNDNTIKISLEFNIRLYFATV